MAGTLHTIGTKALLRGLAVPDLQPQERAILDLFDGPRMVTHAEIIDELWGCDESGGPILPYQNIAVRVLKLRRKGYPIQSHYQRGYSLGAR